MHAKPDLRAFFILKITGSGSVIVAVIRLKQGRSCLKFSLRTLLVSTAVFALAMGWLVHSLASMNVDFASNGNDISFSSAEFAAAATRLNFTIQFDSLDITVDGIYIPNARLENNVARFNIKLKGQIDRTVTTLQPKWPFTKVEFTDMIENELEQRLGLESQPGFARSTLPMGK